MSRSDVTTYLNGFEPEQRQALQSVRDVIVKTLPRGEEVIAWGMPSIRIDGDLVLSYAGFKKHNTIFPGLGLPFEGFGVDVEKYRTSKGALQFDRDRPFPQRLLKQIIAIRIDEINESYPKKSGVFKEFYKNGQLKLKGKMKNGERVGEWVSFTREGKRLKVTRF